MKMKTAHMSVNYIKRYNLHTSYLPKLTVRYKTVTFRDNDNYNKLRRRMSILQDSIPDVGKTDQINFHSSDAYLSCTNMFNENSHLRMYVIRTLISRLQIG